MEYFDYNNVFLAENIIKLLENIRINKHAIKLKKGKQPLFGPIYSLRLVKLETLKIYIKTNLANGFIWLFKFFAQAHIFFNRKLDRSFYFYYDY